MVERDLLGRWCSESCLINFGTFRPFCIITMIQLYSDWKTVVLGLLGVVVASMLPFGRLAAAPNLHGQIVSINLEQVRRGLAWVYVKYARSPEMFAAERDARHARRGLWADLPVEPWLWRKKHLSQVKEAR